jgi:hypothetical protein
MTFIAIKRSLLILDSIALHIKVKFLCVLSRILLPVGLKGLD